MNVICDSGDNVKRNSCKKCQFNSNSSKKQPDENVNIMENAGDSATVRVEPMIVRKTPKFPSRERHMAIRRKKSIPLNDENSIRSHDNKIELL